MKDSKYSANVILETALMFAIIFITTITTSYVPIISSVGMFILSIPITLLYVRHDYKIALIAVFMSMLLTAFLVNPILAINSGIMCGFTGIALGYSIKKNLDSTISIIMVAISSLIGNIMTIMFYLIFILNKGIIGFLNSLIAQFREQVDLAKDMYIAMDMPEELIKNADQFKELITIENLAILIPMSLVISSLIQAYLNYLMTEKVLKRLNYKVKDIIPFSRIYIPNKFAALLIIIQCLGVIIYSRGINVGSYISTIGGLAVQGTCTLSGIAYFAYLLRERAKAPKGLTAVILIIVLFIPLFMNAFVLLGLMDIIFNLRGLDPSPIRIKKSREKHE